MYHEPGYQKMVDIYILNYERYKIKPTYPSSTNSPSTQTYSSQPHTHSDRPGVKLDPDDVIFLTLIVGQTYHWQGERGQL